EQPLEQRTRALRQPVERGREIEEHDRGGLRRRAALERVEPVDGSRILGVAREPVDRVRREDDDAPGRDDAGEVGGHHRVPPPPARPIPARSSTRSASNPSARISPSTTSPWPSPCSTATNRAPAAASISRSKTSP